MEKLFHLHKEFEAKRMSRDVSDVKLADDKTIAELKLSLEDEIKSFCR